MHDRALYFYLFSFEMGWGMLGGGCFSVVSIDLELLQSSSPFVLALESVAGITGAINHSQLLLGLARPIASVSL